MGNDMDKKGILTVRMMGTISVEYEGDVYKRQPYINASETRPLEAGMILAMEVPCYIDGVNGFNIEDMVLITEDGCEVLRCV